jgi:hypothetical protein
MTSETNIARLTVTLEDVEPAVVRRLDVPVGLRLDRLHMVLQVAIGWTDMHLWEFYAGEIRWGLPDPDWPDGPLDARKTTLKQALDATGTKTLQYVYDFGDGWEHVIKIERIDEAAPNAIYPRLIAATGRCPPEDVGGPWGYAEFLEAIADPKHERHDELTEWIGDDFDPTVVETDWIEQELTTLAKRWSRKRKPTRPSK